MAHSDRLHGFAPVVNDHTYIVVLGSFPGVASLQKQEYYGHPRNQFWHLLQDSLGVPLVGLPYEARLQTLLDNHVGLWDVFASCQRHGSLDSAIQHAEHTDFEHLRSLAPQLQQVVFNGQTAGKAAPVYAAHGYATVVLPSSSPAHAALSYSQKLERWQQALLLPMRQSRLTHMTK